MTPCATVRGEAGANAANDVMNGIKTDEMVVMICSYD